jgi:hypothetical protein
VPIIGGGVAGGGGAQAVLTATVPLTSADILALATTPITVVAGVPGKVIVPVLFFGLFTPVTATYSAVGTWRIFTGPTFGSSGFGALAATDVVKLDATVATHSIQLTPYSDGGEAATLNTGQPLRVDLAGAVTTGDGTATIAVWYTLVSGT